jgi:hypothetical protein
MKIDVVYKKTSPDGKNFGNKYAKLVSGGGIAHTITTHSSHGLDTHNLNFILEVKDDKDKSCE